MFIDFDEKDLIKKIKSSFRNEKFDENKIKTIDYRDLSSDEVDNVEKIIKAIAFTIDQMKKIDNLTKNWI